MSIKRIFEGISEKETAALVAHHKPIFFHPQTFGVSFTVQGWAKDKLEETISGLSYNAAKEIAQAWAHVWTTRLLSDVEDYCEVRGPYINMRCGTVAETTLVYE